MKDTVKKYVWQCWYVLVTMFGTLFINLNLDKKVSLINSLSGNNVLYILLFVVYLIGIRKASMIKNKRLKICVRYFSCFIFTCRSNADIV